MNSLKSLLFQRSRRILLLAFVLLATAGAFYQDAPFYLVNKNGTLVIQARYTIDGASLTNTNISLPATLAGTGLQINGGTILTSQTGTGTSIVTNTSPTITGTALLNRERVTGGSAVVAGDFALGAGWGTGASITFPQGTSTDALGSVSITAGTTPSANPLFTFTFHDGAFPTQPVCMAIRGDSIPPANAPLNAVTTSTTQMFVLFNGTPVASSIYVINWDCKARSA